MIIAIASGKGGTGKTTIAVNLALSLQNVQLIDCDVEEPNTSIFIKPNIQEIKKATLAVPQINEELCNYCGKCQEVCEYNAIAVMPQSDAEKGKVFVLKDLCHGCGACSYFCPQKAVSEVHKEIGEIEIGERKGLDFVQGKLHLNEPMAPPVIRQSKQFKNKNKIIIIDAPPGTSCPVITAVEGSDFCVLVTEPTPFGLNDLRLAVETMEILKIPFGVVINRFDIGDDKTENYCQNNNIPILMRIPFDVKIAKIYSKGDVIVNSLPIYKRRFQEMFRRIEALLRD